jgi:hypothetical protein
MGNLVKETPYSEITATLEVFNRYGIGREHFARLRSDEAYVRKVVEYILYVPDKRITDLLSDWDEFYDGLRIPANFANLEIPVRRKGFNRLLVIPQGLTIQDAYDKCEELFPCRLYINGSLGDAISTNDRDPKDGAYAIWVRNRVDADEEFKNLSANNLDKLQITSITILERIIFELKYFKETGKHLDMNIRTLCAGSRYSDDSVPCVGWAGGKLEVGSYFPANVFSDLRSRAVVS